MLGADSTVDGLALSGRIRLYRGDIAGAMERFKAAGPYAGDRAEATERTALLALLQPIEADSLPELGQALLSWSRATPRRPRPGWSAWPRTAARTAVRSCNLLAGRLAAAQRQARPRPSGCSGRPRRRRPRPQRRPPSWRWRELLLGPAAADEAVALLEHLILTYPESALVPQARRQLDEARGAVPQT